MGSSGSAPKGGFFKTLSGVTADHGLGLMGIGAATCSIAFAFVMITRDDSTPFFGGAEHLEIFSQPSSGVRPRIVARAPDQGIDYEPTASIPRDPPPAPPDHIVAPPVVMSGEAAALRAAAPMQGYVLRSVEDGIAFVDGPRGRLYLQAGMSLPDMGRIVAIERRAGQWMVVTQGGIIGEPRR